MLISMKKQKILSQMKGQDKTPGKNLNKVEIGSLPEEERTVSQQLKQTNKKTYYRNLITMKKQKLRSHMKGQDKTPEKQLNEVDIGNLPEKEFKIMMVRMIQDLGERMEAKIEKMQEMFTKDLE